MPPRIGLFVRDGRVTVVAVTRDRLEHFVVEDAEDPAVTLAAELRARDLRRRGIRVGLDRRLAVVKAIELPRAAGSDIAAMVGFDLERHVPFAPEGARFDWVELGSGPDEPHRTPQGFHLQIVVEDGDLWWNRAVEAGCTVVVPFEKMFWGDRWGLLTDPYGLSWSIDEPARA